MCSSMSRESPALVPRRDQNRKRADPVDLALTFPRIQECIAPVRWHPAYRDAVAFGDQLVAFERNELKRGEVDIETRPEAIRDRVVEQKLRPDSFEPLLRLRSRNDVHLRSSSATAWAARPSLRPVKPSSSVVVARTFTSPSPIAA